MKQFFKKSQIVFLLTVFLLNLSVSATAGEAAEPEEVLKQTAEQVYNINPKPQNGSVGGEWAIIGLAGSDTDIPDEYFGDYYKRLCDYVISCDGILHSKKYTEYSRTVLALAVIGKNPSDVCGYNLVLPLTDFEKTSWQGINGTAWALIALDSVEGKLSEKDNTALSEVKDMYINELLSLQLTDGGFSLVPTDESADADITAMVLTALASHIDKENVKETINRGLKCLSIIQGESGGFVSEGGETCESTAQVLIAMSSLGITQKDERFVKNGNTVYDALLSFYDNNGGFYHLKGDTGINAMATEQALCALAMYNRFLKGDKGIFSGAEQFDIAENNDNYSFGLPGKNPAVKKRDIIYEEKSFSDIAESDNRTAIEELAKRGIISGKTKDLFDPDASMTRAEFAAISVRALGIDEIKRDSFSDVTASDWYYGYIGAAAEYNIINGISETEFNPLGTITREEALTMLSRAALLCGCEEITQTSEARDILSVFFDYVKISSWAQLPCAMCVKCGIFDDSAEEIEPKQIVTRAEIAQMLYNLQKAAELF